jgi:hypothetical protein
MFRFTIRDVLWLTVVSRWCWRGSSLRGGGRGDTQSGLSHNAMLHFS